MAGRGSRFQAAGYTFPKPLIEVNGDPMIKVVTDNIGLKAQYIYIVLKEHYDNYSLKYLLPLISEKYSDGRECKIIVVDSVTEGAACTILLAKEAINVDEELVIANSDQWIDWRGDHFIEFARRNHATGAILTFISTHPKWSFVKVDELSNSITEVAEKKPISNVATVGIYYFVSGKFFVGAAEKMIEKNIRTNGEFYVAPVYNEIIATGHKVVSYPVPEMEGLGTPEDLQLFITKRLKK